MDWNQSKMDYLFKLNGFLVWNCFKGAVGSSVVSLNSQKYTRHSILRWLSPHSFVILIGRNRVSDNLLEELILLILTTLEELVSLLF